MNYNGATEWRDYAKKELEKHGINAVSPMRSKEYLKQIENYDARCTYGDIHVMSSPKGIMTRDFFDCRTCDVLLVNLLGAKEKSIGTIMEIAWAYMLQTPIVCVMEKENNVHEHAMLDQAVLRVEDLDVAIQMVASIIGNSEVKL